MNGGLGRGNDTEADYTLALTTAVFIKRFLKARRSQLPSFQPRFHLAGLNPEEMLRMLSEHWFRPEGQIPKIGIWVQRFVFNTAASRAAPVREAVISVPTRSRNRTR